MARHQLADQFGACASASLPHLRKNDRTQRAIDLTRLLRSGGAAFSAGGMAAEGALGSSAALRGTADAAPPGSSGRGSCAAKPVAGALAGGGEVFVLAFVFPAEVAAHPDVGPTVSAIGFVDAALESVPGAYGIGFGGLRLAEQVTEVKEVLLASAPLGERNVPPFFDELLWRHRGYVGCWVR